MFFPLLFENSRFSGIFILIQPNQPAMLRGLVFTGRRKAAPGSPPPPCTVPAEPHFTAAPPAPVIFQNAFILPHCRTQLLRQKGL